MLRTTKILLILTVALWGLVGAFHNILEWNETLSSVAFGASMEVIDGAESWKATSNPALIWLGALFITLSKTVTGIMCTIGARRMWQAKSADQATFTKAKEIALVGCGISVIMLFGGFIVIAESWFEMWRSPELSSSVLQSAFRYAGMITLIALFVGSKDD